MEKVSVSILLPTYNGEKYIARAIESVIAQTLTDWELLILSDGSVDKTKGIVERYATSDRRIIFIENDQNLGIQKTLNKGLALAKGRYIARIDDDDRWFNNDKLSIQVAYLSRNTEYVLVGTDAVVLDEEGNVLSKNTMPKSDKEIRSRILSKNCFLHASVLIEKASVDKVGGYSTEKKFLHAEDYELWLRLGTVGKFCNLSGEMAQLTNHAASLTSNNRVLQAKNILTAVYEYRKKYPHFLIGYFVALLRYVFFAAVSGLPFSNSLFYYIQRIYKKM